MRQLARREATILKFWSNTCGGVPPAKAWLRSSYFETVPTDKDGGFALVHRRDLQELVQEKLSEDFYEESFVPNVFSFMEDYRNIIMKVSAAFRDDELKAFLFKAMGKCDPNRIVSRLLFTLKTHKAPGYVSTRLIHSGTLHPFTGVASILRTLWAREMQSWTHVVKNTTELIQRITSRSYGQRFFFVKLYLKDFYMMGDHQEMAEKTCAILEHGNVLENALGYILHCQYVGSDLFPGKVWRVTGGTGIGQTHSGELADMYFYLKVERPFSANPEVMRQHCILEYIRFRDDIFLIATDVMKWCDYHNGLKEQMGVTYKVEVDSVSWHHVNMLDVTVHKGDAYKQRGVLDVKPYSKPSEQKIPLGSNSNHPDSVHRSWPVAEIHRNPSAKLQLQCVRNGKGEHASEVFSLRPLRGSGGESCTGRVLPHLHSEAATNSQDFLAASPISRCPLTLQPGFRVEGDSRALVSARAAGTAAPSRHSHSVAEERPEPPRASSAEVALGVGLWVVLLLHFEERL